MEENEQELEKSGTKEDINDYRRRYQDYPQRIRHKTHVMTKTKEPEGTEDTQETEDEVGILDGKQLF